jgi:hypothetical protein
MDGDIRALLSDTEITEQYRALGDDYAAYGVNTPAGSPDPLKEGYRAGRERHIAPHSNDRFVRKWLQIRYQALGRGRAVSDDVSPEFLRKIDIAVCPITLVTLTHAKSEESDWSVDRLNNDGAYAVSNLAIMSTRANRAKGAKSLAQVRKLAEADGTSDGLTPREWARMAATMFGPCGLSRPEEVYFIRQVVRIPEQVTRGQWQALQDCLVRAALGEATSAGPILPVLLKAMPNNQLRGWTTRLVRQIQERAPKLEAPFDVWFDDDPFLFFQRFFEFLHESTHGQPLQVMQEFYQKTAIGERILHELRFATRGFQR